ncbi:TetR/AcrR family transcriptional regulator [Knoellia koreensis]|uniref:TetR family transcriptional regulator n=1 Tax=Knoellia koreensis TaxID=2730921 RepID=A0A849HKY9_9MICO|nr:TetR/AcrR family transcriptional regulator [Knoellia sp. DB2414S]NNM47972.1 TetR family transcriptional regulator [Knoellia sp. DB2414S]
MSTTPDRPTAAPEGLRARNRAQTARRLEEAAWEIVAERGFEAATADAIAERAGVSRRTLFNYYPRVELVLQEPMREAIAGLVDRFLARPSTETMRESLAAILTEPLEAEVLEKAVVCFSQAATSPAARYFLVDAQAAEVAQVAEAVMARLADAADPIYAEVVARSVMAAGTVATLAWLDQSRGVVDDDTRWLHLELLRQAFSHLYTAFSEPATPDADLTTPIDTSTRES